MCYPVLEQTGENKIEPHLSLADTLFAVEKRRLLKTIGEFDEIGTEMCVCVCGCVGVGVGGV